MLQEKSDSGGSLDSPLYKATSKITWKTNLRALFYKSVKLQQRNYCANICQIITPLLCVAFTLVVQIISNDIITTKIQMPIFPRPFDLPLLYQILPLSISCQQLYLYDYDGFNKEQAKAQIDQFLGTTLKRYCSETKGLQPIYNYTENMNREMVDVLKEAEKEKFVNGQDLKAPIADGILKFHEISQNKLNVTIGINDYRMSEYHKNNGVTKLSISTDSIIVSYLMTTQGMMSLIEKVTRSFLAKIDKNQIIFGSYMYMPFDGEDRALVNKTINVIGTGLYPLGLALLLPLFLYSIVSQKEQKLIEIMRMNGLDLKYYWVNTFIFNFLISMITFSIFYGFGCFVLELQFFTDTNPVAIWIVLIGWGIAQISLTNLVQIFISNGKSATIIGYLLSIFSTLVGETIAVFVYSLPMVVPNWLLIFPPFALCRSFYLLGMLCATTGCVNDLQYLDPQLIKCIIILYSWFFVFLLSIWLNDMVQQQYGVAKNISCTQKIRNIFRKGDPEQLKQDSQMQMQLQMEDILESTTKIDESVLEMKRQVLGQGVKDKNLVIKELMKKYSTSNGEKDYVALKPFTFALEDKEIFGLLGPNGAGKTTLISVLTGMYPKTKGNAWINGVKIGSKKVNEFIGVCPQFDLLWPTLTVYEHLKFYALLKGVDKTLLQATIRDLLIDVDLSEWKNTKSQQLSGGMQRRLSIAIALISSPSVVFLDEPSSGLDPSHRRRLWNILNVCKKRTSIILTTHLMEQAQALCDRIGIISKGELRCIGQTQQLKGSFGEGYRLFINFINLLSSDNEKIVREIQMRFGAKILNHLETRVIFKVEKQRILECVGWLRHEKSINWLVSQPSLYDVFMNFID